MPGSPGSDTPSQRGTSEPPLVSSSRSAYQSPGARSARCGSLASLGLPDLVREPLGIELGGPARREVLVHEQQHGERIGRRPVARRVAQERELEAEVARVRAQPEVDALRVLLEERALLGREQLDGRLRDLAKA